MAKFFPEAPPFPLSEEQRKFLDYVFRELNRISVALFTEVYLNLEKKFVEPTRPQDGDVSYADGTSWNPGSGAGIYAYINGVWVKLNLSATDDITMDDLTVDTINLTGGQIIFPAVQNPSAGANTLDDYEEGTWTPTFQVGGSGSGVTYAIQTGRYTKIGRAVILEGDLILTNNGTNVGACTINSLPFTIATECAASVVGLSGFTGITAGIQGIFPAGTSSIGLRAPSTTGTSSVAETQAGNSAAFRIGGAYSV